MQIFATSPDPQQCAQVLDNVRVNSQIRESAQILSTALHNIGFGAPNLYAPTHTGNRLILWTQETRANFDWLFNHAFCLSEEWSCRYAKVHASHTIIEHCGLLREALPEGPRTPFVNMTPYSDMDVHKAYKKLLIDKWRKDVRTPRWSHREPPAWAKKEIRVVRNDDGVYIAKRG